MKHLPISIKKIWLQSAGINALLWLLLIIAYNIGRYFWSWVPLWGLLIILGLAVCEVGVEIALIPYRYAFYKYVVNETDVEIQRGFFFRKEVSIPIARVQNVDLEQGPLLRVQKLHKVMIATGGSMHSVEALTQSEAHQFKDQVMKLAREARNAN